MSLRPQAESTHCRTAARCIHRDERVEEKWDVIASNIEIAFVDFGDPWQRVEILDHRRLRVADDLPILAEGGARNLLDRLAVGVIDDLVIELAPDYEVDGAAGIQSLLRLDRYRRADEEQTFIFGLASLIISEILMSTSKTGSGGEQNE